MLQRENNLQIDKRKHYKIRRVHPSWELYKTPDA